MKSTVWKSEAARGVLLEWFDKFRGRLTVPTESRVVATRFGDTHVLVGGPVDGRSVVVLHGALASSAHALVELAPLLARFRVYAVDVVGQSAKSADARPSVANDDYARWLEDVLEGLALARTHVVGVSWGGFVAIRLAAARPARIDRLALLVPAGVVKSPAWAGLTKIGIPMLLYRMFPSPKRLAAFTRNLLTTTDDDWMPYLGDAFRSFNMDMRVPPLATPAELAGFTSPTLVIGADADVSFPGEGLLARARELFPRVDRELIPESRHCPPTTDAFRRWLGDRLTSFLLPS